LTGRCLDLVHQLDYDEANNSDKKENGGKERTSDAESRSCIWDNFFKQIETGNRDLIHDAKHSNAGQIGPYL
jgi:hypothetical protein